MSIQGPSSKRTAKHPYLTGNFAPVTKTWPPTPVTWTGDIPEELHGGMYVRNGGNPVTNSHLGREAHWFDGDGMLSGVWFHRSHTDPRQSVVNFVNQFVLTDVYLSAADNGELQTPILPSISTLVNPASSLFFILWRILRTLLIVILSHLPGSRHAIKRISVANTNIIFHDSRALATCESGPPIRVTLPSLETVGWYDGNRAEGEAPLQETRDSDEEQRPGFGGAGPLSWMKEWTTGHPKVDKVTGELVLFHCNFAPPYVHYSLVPTEISHANEAQSQLPRILNAPVPGCSGGKLMHDFGVSRLHTVILDLPLTLTPLNLAKNKPVVSYDPNRPARFGVFPRRHPELVRWYETSGCCIFHTANAWDETDLYGNVTAVNMLACRLTSASLVFSAANIVPPPHPARKDLTRSKPMSFFARYHQQEQNQDVEKLSMDETSPLLVASVSGNKNTGPSKTPSSVPMSYDEQEQCRLYYYRFSLCLSTSNTITHQFALSSIPFEFPTVSPITDMDHARYIYGCSTSVESFGAALGKATKIDVLVRMDVKALLARAQRYRPEAVTGCVDNRTIDEILASEDPNDPIKAFKLPPNHYGQEARFIPRGNQTGLTVNDPAFLEESGHLLFYVFNEDQLDVAGECTANSKSELWVLDASTMRNVTCKIHLPTRISYGLHGNWFTEDQITGQRGVETLRSLSDNKVDNKWTRMQRNLTSRLG
ncbi:carotenoid oxygenase [Cucurbitaria berberidis CBS 394.84]|uniref:Carotenoid oxygenase n=1 Tax=Cucurbitaria berberidis CBS 394.84 TaxID=1168544 RepID=A0A9P4G994_9PLEO|nr:carotenoid oxygenase [Cucurbitaria berberidis CBS 394.84]KAF1841412.1 carotenoid oxygenase [Cucurbitaria berberidis CBS 394.84]